MAVWRPTRDEQRAIRAYACRAARARRVELEIGIFYDLATDARSTNDLLLGESDLADHMRWDVFCDTGAELTEDGQALVDIYVSARDELQTNVLVAVEQGQMVRLDQTMGPSEHFSLRSPKMGVEKMSQGNSALRDRTRAMTTKTEIKTVEITTQPLRRTVAPRVVAIPQGVTIDRCFNNDGSITLYAKGLKVFRTASEQDIEDGVVSENYDAEEACTKFLRKWFGKNKEIVIGRTTHGHNWKNRKRTAPEG